MTDADLIRAAASPFLRENEERARQILACNDARNIHGLLRLTGWSDWRVNSMLTYLAMVDD